MSWLVTKYRAFVQRYSHKDSRRKRGFENQDKRRWRDLLLWFLPLLTASVIAVIAVPDAVRFWVAIVSFLFLLFYLAILLERYIWRTGTQHRKLRAALVLAFVLVIAGGVKWHPRPPTPSPPRRPWLRFTDEERQKFISALASQTEPREHVRLGCPAANEEICVLVTPFVDAFKRGHFIVEDNRIDRLTLSQPSAGVVLFKYGHADAYNSQDPDQGVWVRQTPSMETIEEPFAEIGINLTQTADEKMPKDVIGVYFGIEPYEPIERKNLKQIRQDAEKELGITPSP